MGISLSDTPRDIKKWTPHKRGHQLGSESRRCPTTGFSVPATHSLKGEARSRGSATTGEIPTDSVSRLRQPDAAAAVLSCVWGWHCNPSRDTVASCHPHKSVSSYPVYQLCRTYHTSFSSVIALIASSGVVTTLACPRHVLKNVFWSSVSLPFSVLTSSR